MACSFIPIHCHLNEALKEQYLQLTDTYIVDLGWVQTCLRKSCLRTCTSGIVRNSSLNKPHTLSKACSISSTGWSLSCPFLYRPIAVRAANVMTTSVGFFFKMACKPCACVVDAYRTSLNGFEPETRKTGLSNIVLDIKWSRGEMHDLCLLYGKIVYAEGS